MSLELWLAFAAASAAVLLIPGPTALAVMAYSAAARGRILSLVAAVVLGDLTALCMSLLGLGALLTISAFGFIAAKVAGGLYLVYLGASLLFRDSAAAPVSSSRRNAKRMFADVYFITAFNPKGIIFFAAFLPQFVDAEAAAAPQFMILGATFLLLAAANAALYAAASAESARRLSAIKGSRRFGEVAGGVALIGAGAWALTAGRS